MRTIAIGDIHGCSTALLGLLEMIDPRPTDRLVFLGDYVDRGPDARGVIDILLDLRSQCQTVFLLGNHEIMFRGALRGLDPRLWLEIGGRPTLTSYGGELTRVRPEHVEFLDACLPYFECDDHIFVHANYLAELPMCEQPEHALYWEHLSERVPDPHFSGKHVWLGHTPQVRGNIGSFGHFTCLDTGCVGGYWLSAVDVGSGETWQVSKLGHLRNDWRVLKKLAALLRMRSNP
ncbi:MAG: serine/threonine protein phosphatase [bacterium]|nr:serine/threonine protein phosphatase [bacterium]